MNYKNISDNDLLVLVKAKSKEERALTLEVIQLIREVDIRKLYLERGYGSLFEFIVKELGYDDSGAVRRMNAARTIRELPQTESKIASGDLSLSNVSQAYTFFRKEAKLKNCKVSPETKRAILESLENKSTRDAQKILLEFSPRQVSLREVEKIVAPELIELRFVISDKLKNKLEILKNHFSHIETFMTHAELFEKLADMALEKIAKKVTLPTSAPKLANTAQARTRHIPEAVKREVFKRDGGCCSFVDPQTKRRCASKFQVEDDHKFPFALGGDHSVENLRLYCRAHNQFVAKRLRQANM